MHWVPAILFSLVSFSISYFGVCTALIGLNGNLAGFVKEYRNKMVVDKEDDFSAATLISSCVQVWKCNAGIERVYQLFDKVLINVIDF